MFNMPVYANVNVLVVGDLMLDCYIHGEAQRISPEAPVPVIKVREREMRLGGAGNVAQNISALGANTTLLAVIGQDEAASQLATALKATDITHELLVDPRVTTVCKERVISQHQQLIRYDREDEALWHCDKQSLLACFHRHLAAAQVVLLSDYAKGTLSDVQILIKSAVAAGIPVFVDPKDDDFSRYRGATLITPNRKEFEAVVGSCADEAMLVKKALEIAQYHVIEHILVTRGDAGMTLVSRNGEFVHLKTHAREVYDVTGAGDTVIATLAASYAAGVNLRDAMRLANAAASIVVGRLGASSVTVAELRHCLQTIEGKNLGVLTQAQLQQAVADAKLRSERIVFTNGCFDILHAGHVQYLAQAKALGDRLIVAVNSDASVRQLKGDSRPINPLAQRMQVLAGLRSVDWVVDFAEETPDCLIKLISPHILVKGSDYQVREIAGHEHVLGQGGEVKTLDFLDGCSTTRTIEAISNLQKMRLKSDELI